MTVEIRALERSDDRQAFSCGDEALDVYFHRYAGQNQFRHHLGVTYVAVEAERILGFVTVSPGSLDADDLTSGPKNTTLSGAHSPARAPRGRYLCQRPRLWKDTSSFRDRACRENDGRAWMRRFGGRFKT